MMVFQDIQMNGLFGDQEYEMLYSKTIAKSKSSTWRCHFIVGTEDWSANYDLEIAAYRFQNYVD